MMRTNEKDFALLYFENESVVPNLNNFKPNTDYVLQWFNTISGEWSDEIKINSDEKGTIVISEFPKGGKKSSIDWAAKIIEK